MEDQNKKLQQQVDELIKKVADLTTQFNLLKNSTTIPFDIDNAFRKRLEVPSAVLNSTASSAHSSGLFIDEAGSATHNIVYADEMTGFITIYIDGNPYLVPYY